ncbi:hypothetical protein [Rouxiella badensis]|uniref:hypothetical protein n=1 Tax=Rouxiella badensis TaxID=1646377 RepID=UPI003C3831BF
MTRTDTHFKNDAIDALEKIRVILQAALFLTATDSERDVSLVLMGLAEEVAICVLEANR